ncbi:MAG: DEAD/DEAH box helicase [Microbacteriaceae bacterium]|nr:DEAD/DEAH box helicase [Microbacteriaceae bacterium]MCI1206777.1 DEAD/DEAH box helicase [Microbacteriaceae bacterium]
MKHRPGYSAQSLPPAFPARSARGTAPKLRAWQQEALGQYFRNPQRDFLVAATPGAGKTTFALQLTSRLFAEGTIQQVIVVAPTDHLRGQWAEAGERAGLLLDPNFRNADRQYGAQYAGISVTYAQVAANPDIFARIVTSRPALVVLDEVHHGGDALSWGEAIREAFRQATRRLSLTGTPFRSDDAPIPFVRYRREPDGTRVSESDYQYGYSKALADGVVRPVLFLAYSGKLRWRTKMGEVMSAVLDGIGPRDLVSGAWRAALDPRGEWISQVLRAADRRLTEVRKGMPDAGGLVIAGDQRTARAYSRILADIAGEPVTTVLSDEAGSGERIAAFNAGTQRWMVAVRMVSEGVDVPRLAVGVYATSASTPLYFAQVIGRFVRARRRGETATVFLPSVAQVLGLATGLERERDHVLGAPKEQGDDLLAEAQRSERASEQLLQPDAQEETLDADASFDRALFDGDELAVGAGLSLEEQDFLGFPGLLDPSEAHALLARHRSTAPAPEAARPAQPLYVRLRKERKELARLVSVWSKISGEPHGSVHMRLRRACGGPSVAQADESQLKARIAKVRDWINN